MAHSEAGEFESGIAHIELPVAIASMRVDPSSPVPLYQQLCSALRHAITVGDLPSGAQIPTSRELATAMRVGRNTVVRTYSQLVAEGYLVSNRRCGTQVAKDATGTRAFATVKARAALAADREIRNVNKIEISFRAQESLKRTIEWGPREGPFALNVPDTALFPRNRLGRILAEEFSRMPGSDGAEPMRRFQTAMSAYLRARRGLTCDPSQIIPVKAIESALDLTSRVLIDPGHCVLVEDPSLPVARQAFSMAGARIARLPADKEGADPFRAASPPPRLIFTSPSVSFPTAQQMTKDRRIEMCEFAQRSSAIILEADTYWELLYCSDRLRPLHGIDESNQVIYFGSLNETLGPFIRCGYLVVPPDLVTPFSETLKRVGYGPEPFIMASIARFMEDGQYALHVRTLRSLYGQRMMAAVQAIRKHLPDWIAIEPAGGLHITLLLPRSFNEIAVCHACARQGCPVAPLSSFHQTDIDPSGVVLGFGTVAERNVESVVQRFAEIASDTLGGTGKPVPEGANEFEPVFG